LPQHTIEVGSASFRKFAWPRPSDKRKARLYCQSVCLSCLIRHSHTRTRVTDAMRTNSLYAYWTRLSTQVCRIEYTCYRKWFFAAALHNLPTG